MHPMVHAVRYLVQTPGRSKRVVGSTNKFRWPWIGYLVFTPRYRVKLMLRIFHIFYLCFVHQGCISRVIVCALVNTRLPVCSSQSDPYVLYSAYGPAAPFFVANLHRQQNCRQGSSCLQSPSTLLVKELLLYDLTLQYY